ncbi:MAG: BON domain-containing protein [Planctomycetes bacterium]|nr:BON domain-containing protein [Planctomycetota bacterium]
MKFNVAVTRAVSVAATVACIVAGGGCGSLSDLDSGPGGHSALYQSGTGTLLAVNAPQDAVDLSRSNGQPAAPTAALPSRQTEADGAAGRYVHRVENSDASIVAAIRAKLQNAHISPNGRNVDVIAESARVTLRGTVDSLVEKETIARLARQVAGAARVDDQIDVVMAR